MIKYTLCQWKSKKVTIFLIILGFFVGCLILSVGISITYENYMSMKDQTSGDPDSQLDITFKYDEKITVDDLKQAIQTIAEYGEVQLLSMSNVYLDDYDAQCPVIPVVYKNALEWHIPIIKGNYFQQHDVAEHKVVIGQNIATKNEIEVGDAIRINNEEYCVVGVCGRKNRETIWDDCIYVIFDAFFYDNTEYFFNDDINIIFGVLKEGKKEFEKNFSTYEVINNVTVEYSDVIVGESAEAVFNSFKMTILSSSLVFIIAIANIINLMSYWIMDRRLEIGIMKAIGASDKSILKWIIIEIVIMSSIGAFLALLIQKILSVCLNEYLLANEINITLSWVNISISLMVSLICGLIAAIIPAKKTMKFNPSDII